MELDTCAVALSAGQKASFDYARWSDFLPDKLWTKILRNLSSRDVCVLAQVDKKFSALCSDETVWQYLFIRQFAKTYADSRIGSIAASCRSWKTLCKGGQLPPTVDETTSDLPAGSAPTPQQSATSPSLQSSSSHDHIPVPSCSSTLASAPTHQAPPDASAVLVSPSRCAPSLRALASSQLPLRKRFKGCSDFYTPATASPLGASGGNDLSSSDERPVVGSPSSSSGNSVSNSYIGPSHLDLPPRKAHKWAQLTRDVKSPTPPPADLPPSQPQTPAARPVSPVPSLIAPVQSPPLTSSPLPPVLKPVGTPNTSQPKKRVQIASPPSATPKKPKAKQRPVDSVGEPLYCFCRRRYDPKVFMIACDLCDEWYHGACVGITEQQAAKVASYVCPTCRGEGNPIATAANSDAEDDAFDDSFRTANGMRKKRKTGVPQPPKRAAA